MSAPAIIYLVEDVNPILQVLAWFAIPAFLIWLGNRPAP